VFQSEQQLQGSQLAMNATSMMLPSALSPIASLGLRASSRRPPTGKRHEQR
jgi:hypothetical protein